jgi:carbon monoxide dehydrogenase subunit G
VAIELEETFVVRAPIDAVWAFVLDPQRVASCMPGAALDEVVDERTFHGSIRVKVGAVSTSYKGRVQFTQLDEAGRSVEMVAEGRETGGGTAKGGMTSRLRSLGNGETEVAVQASVEMTGRVAQVGRGLIQGVSQELFRQFVACAKASLESPEGEAAAAAVARANEPLRILPLVLRATWAAIVRFFRRLLRRPA